MTKINRSEFLFVYDAKRANPNGDPNDENKPRYDYNTSHILVSDVRLKRTVRDYLEENGETIFITKKGKARTSAARAKEIVGDCEDTVESILEKTIDVRMFGGMLPTKLSAKGTSGDSVVLLGPIQIRMGESFHAVDLNFFKGTAAFASNEKAKNNSFREEWLVPYALISFYGVINQNAAVETKLGEEDVEKFFEALWYGTKNLITRSKMEQLPRLLVQIEYKPEINTHIGELDSYVDFETDKDELSVSSTKDYRLNMTELFKVIRKYSDKILRLRYAVSDKLNIAPGFEELEDIKIEKFGFN